MFKIIVRFESKIIQEIELDPAKEYMAGRDDACQILLKGKSGISRQHFKIYFNGSQWQVDVISKFGHLNYRAQEVNSIVLEPGNSFSLAPFDFQFIEEKPLAEIRPTTTSPIENPPATLENDTVAIEPLKNNLPQVANAQDDFMGDDEKTSIGVMGLEPIIQITHVSGEALGSFHLKQGTLWIAGRDDSCDIKIPDKKASRKHFEISRTHTGFVINDLGSSNGTRVNGRKISPNSSLQLSSGDIINVASVNVRFETKNVVVEQQLKHLPDVLFNQTVVSPPGGYVPAVMDGQNDHYMEAADGGGFKNAALKLNPRVLLIGAVVLFLLYILTSEVKDPNSKEGNVVRIDDNPLNKLTSEQRQMIKESYASAQSLSQKGNYELALSELDKIHKLVPFYEQSKELESTCNSGLMAIRERQQYDMENKKAQELAEYIAKLVETCKARFTASTTLNDVNTCLAQAIERDPDNSDIASLQQQASQQDDQRALIAARDRDLKEKERIGNEMFSKAERLRKNQELYAALKAYQKYLEEVYPDPQNNRRIASQQVSTLRQTILQKVDELLKQAQDFSTQENFRGALLAITTAKKVDPNDIRIKEVEDKINVVQNKKLLLLYQDAKFEESLGNVQVTKEKCQKIMEMSLPENDYHVKCRKILAKYGG